MEVLSLTTGYAGIDGCDWRGHLSNSAYAKTLDSARMRWCMQIAPALFEDGGWMPVAGTQYNFIHEIPMYSEYEIRTMIGGWEDKWMYLIHHFVTYPKKGSKSKTAEMTRAASIAVGAPNGMAPKNPDMGYAASLPKQRQEYNAPPTVPKRVLRKSLPEGAVIHCIAVSTICFKTGRITIPPRVVLITCSFGAPEKDRWTRIQELRFAPDPKGRSLRKNLLSDILKGGWRTDDEGGERFWELDEFEERRRKAMEEIFDGFQGVLKALKETQP